MRTHSPRAARFWNATIGKKIVMAVSGIALFGFVCVHLLGNLNFFNSVEAMNAYARFLRIEPALLWAARGGLLLMVFLHNSGRVLNRDQLFDLTRGRSSTPLDRSIDIQVSRLRRKIEPGDGPPRLLKTVRGAGYVFTPKVVAT